jgi:hypothetical protein
MTTWDKAKVTAWNHNSMNKGVEKYRIGHRTKYINCGTILVDDMYYFYAKKKLVRIKGTIDYIKVVSFKHFYDEFLRNSSPPTFEEQEYDLRKLNTPESRDEYRRRSLCNMITKFKLADRTKWINNATVLIDDKYYYYAQRRKARVKGKNKYYQMRGFEHFYEVFLREKASW